VKADILSALEAWRTVRLAYAQLKSAVFDLVGKLGGLPAYGQIGARVDTGDSGRRAALREMVLVDGPFSAHRKHVLGILEWLDSNEQELDVLATGFIEVREQTSGQISFFFELYRERRRLSPDELRSRARDISRVLKFGASVLRSVRRQLEAH
jgi:hypothetical protein